MAPIVNTNSVKQQRLEKEERKKWKKKNAIKQLKKLQNDEAKVVEQQNQGVNEVRKELSTVSIAIPGSILDNAQSVELRTYLVGQIARTACMFQVDEIVVFEDNNFTDKKKKSFADGTETKMVSRACTQMVQLLQYLECPQYLRKFLFPVHKNLQYAGLLNPLEAPHHLRTYNTFQFREGLVTNKPTKAGRGSKVNVGFLNDVEIDKVLTPGFRCTVKLEHPVNNEAKKLKGIVVSPSIPRRETGVYWGYTVRLASSFAEVFSKSPFKEGYDLTIGTSDRGESIDDFECPKYEHLLVVFGGLQGLEAALEGDEKLTVEDPKLLFDHYLNTLPDQGSRTLRTEEAILITLTSLRPKLDPVNRAPTFTQFDDIACSADYFHK